MAKKIKNRTYRLSIVEDETHRRLRSFRFNIAGLVVTLITVFVVLLGSLYCLVAFTPLRTTIPGYPDPHFRREAVLNAIKIDSLENAIARWEIYAGNLSRVLAGDKTISLDSLLTEKAKADTLAK
ncbi:MAG: hypothetical protein IJS66_00370 [Bacteroidales bacterium]|nr:hypothetical protein [Bacteroidales bacterium]